MTNPPAAPDGEPRDTYYAAQLENIRREVRSAYESDTFHELPENIRWFYAALQRCLEVIDGAGAPPLSPDNRDAEIEALKSILAARDATIAAALRLAELRWDINVAGNHDPEHLLKQIEAILRGE